MTSGALVSRARNETKELEEQQVTKHTKTKATQYIQLSGEGATLNPPRGRENIRAPPTMQLMAAAMLVGAVKLPKSFQCMLVDVLGAFIATVLPLRANDMLVCRRRRRCVR